MGEQNTRHTALCYTAALRPPADVALNPCRASQDGLYAFAGDVKRFPDMIPSSLMSREKVTAYVKASTAEENKAAIKIEAEALVAQGAVRARG